MMQVYLFIFKDFWQRMIDLTLSDIWDGSLIHYVSTAINKKWIGGWRLNDLRWGKATVTDSSSEAEYIVKTHHT